VTKPLKGSSIWRLTSAYPCVIQTFESTQTQGYTSSPHNMTQNSLDLTSFRLFRRITTVVRAVQPSEVVECLIAGFRSQHLTVNVDHNYPNFSYYRYQPVIQNYVKENYQTVRNIITDRHAVSLILVYYVTIGCMNISRCIDKINDEGCAEQQTQKRRRWQLCMYLLS